MLQKVSMFEEIKFLGCKHIMLTNNQLSRLSQTRVLWIPIHSALSFATWEMCKNLLLTLFMWILFSSSVKHVSGLNHETAESRKQLDFVLRLRERLYFIFSRSRRRGVTFWTFRPFFSLPPAFSLSGTGLSLFLPPHSHTREPSVKSLLCAQPR